MSSYNTKHISKRATEASVLVSSGVVFNMEQMILMVMSCRTATYSGDFINKL